MIDPWLAMWELIGELHAWSISAFDSYTYKYCDECGEKQCTKTGCEASRRGYFGDLGEYIEAWRDPYAQKLT